MNEFSFVADTNFLIKNIAIQIRQQNIVNTPDAIIAATSRFLELPLVTSDKGFKKIKSIEIIFI